MTLFRHIMMLLAEEQSCVSKENIRDTWEEQLAYLKDKLYRPGEKRCVSDWIVCVCFAGYKLGYIYEDEFFGLPGVMSYIEKRMLLNENPLIYKNLREGTLSELDEGINWFFSMSYQSQDVEEELFNHPVVKRFSVQLNKEMEKSHG